MKSSIILFVALGIQVLFAGPAQSQIQKESQIGLSSILSLGGMREELEMSDEQANNLMDLWIVIRDELETEFQNYARKFGGSVSQENQKQLVSDFRATVEKIRDKELASINAVLLPHQVKRLKELHVQYLKRSSDGFETIAEQLELTTVQKEEIKQVGISLKKKIQTLYREARNEGTSTAELAETTQLLRLEAEDELLGVLTPSQREKLKELEGEKFEFQTIESRKQKEEGEGKSDQSESKSEKDRDDG